MRKFTYWTSLILIFMIPWEDSLTIGALGSLARLAGIGIAGFWLAAVLLDGRLRKPHLFHALALLFFLWNAASLFWSPFSASVLQRVKTYAQIYVLTIILWETYQKRSELMAALQAYILGSFVLIYSSIHNYITGSIAVAYEGRYSATGVNAVDMTLILMLGLPIALQLFFMNVSAGKSPLLQILNLAYIPLAIFSALLTGSRTSLVAILPFGVYLVVTRHIKVQKKLLVLGLLLFSMSVLFPFLPSSVISRLSTVGVSIEEMDLGGRVDLWREGIEVLAQHPLMGVGGGAIDLSIGSAVHNTFISIAAETGFIGFLLFSLMLGLAVFDVTRKPKSNVGLWLVAFLTWAIGVLSLSWEFRKITWILLSFMIIESNLTNQASELLPETVQPSFKASGLRPRAKAAPLNK